MAKHSKITPDTRKLFAEQCSAHLDNAVTELRSAMTCYGGAFPDSKRAAGIPPSLLIQDAKTAVRRVIGGLEKRREKME